MGRARRGDADRRRRGLRRRRSRCGFGVLGAGRCTALLSAEARLARRLVGEPFERRARRRRRSTAPGPATPIELVVLGDSSAAGLGVDSPDQTPGAMLATGLAGADRPAGAADQRRRRRRRVHRPGRAGRPTLLAEVAARRRRDHDRRQRRHPPDRASRSPCAHLDEAVRRLREAGAEVVVGTCPDLGTIEPMRPAAAAASPAGGAGSWPRRRPSPSSRPAGGPSRSATCSGRSSPRARTEMFSADRFHPSAAGYARAAAALLPSVCAALGLWSGRRARGRAGPPPRRGRRRRSPHAAVQAVARGRHRGRGHRGRRRSRAARAAGGRCCGAAPRRRSPTAEPTAADGARAISRRGAGRRPSGTRPGGDRPYRRRSIAVPPIRSRPPAPGTR